MRAILLSIMIGLLGGSTAVAGQTDEPRSIRRLRALTPEAAQALVSVTDDPLEPVVTLTTQKVFQEKRGLLGLVPFDTFLRAFVDKKTGATGYQVYASSRYTAPIYTNLFAANYQTTAGPVAVNIDRIARLRERCDRVGCERLEIVGFTVPEPVLRAAAAAYRPGELGLWAFRFKGRTGPDATDGFTAAEIAGLFRAVSTYRMSHRLP